MNTFSFQAELCLEGNNDVHVYTF